MDTLTVALPEKLAVVFQTLWGDQEGLTVDQALAAMSERVRNLERGVRDLSDIPLDWYETAEESARRNEAASNLRRIAENIKAISSQLALARGLVDSDHLFSILPVESPNLSVWSSLVELEREELSALIPYWIDLGTCAMTNIVGPPLGLGAVSSYVRAKSFTLTDQGDDGWVVHGFDADQTTAPRKCVVIGRADGAGEKLSLRDALLKFAKLMNYIGVNWGPVDVEKNQKPVDMGGRFDNL
jgi:hypothetical protein